MPCCAFAVFLLGQLALALDRVRTFIFGARENVGFRPNLAVAWQPGILAEPPANPNSAMRARLQRALSPRMLMLAVSLELVVAIGGTLGVAAQAGYSPTDLTQALTVICRGGQLTQR